MDSKEEFISFTDEQNEEKGIVQDEQTKKLNAEYYKIMIADDAEEVHKVSDLVFKNFMFEGAVLKILHSYSAAETLEILKKNPDVAVLFLDVVMETNRAGLDIIQSIRQDLKNEMVRIIIRTGEPGQAPEEKIISEYDINDYRLKTDMTDLRMKTTLITALRGYKNLAKLRLNQVGLEKIIKASADLFEYNTISDFFKTIIIQLGNFYDDVREVAYIQGTKRDVEGFVTVNERNRTLVIAGTGKYEKYEGREIDTTEDLLHLRTIIDERITEQDYIARTEKGYLVARKGNGLLENYIYIEGKEVELNIDLINVFMTNYTMAVNNFLLRDQMDKTQRQIINTFANTIEKHFEESGAHVERISKMMNRFCRILGYNKSDCDMLEIASTLHDIGKIAIPDSILKKQGRLTEEEFEVIKSHSRIGNDILRHSDLKMLKIAAEITLYHHEKYDGTGYPQGLKGENIPMVARIMALLDVFDAITHKRVYKEAEKVEDALIYLSSQKGMHFDHELVDIFIKHVDEIAEI